MSREIDDSSLVNSQPEEEVRARLYNSGTLRHLSGILLTAGGFVDAAIAMANMSHGGDAIGAKTALAAGLVLCASGIFVERGSHVNSPVEMPEVVAPVDPSLR